MTNFPIGASKSEQVVYVWDVALIFEMCTKAGTLVAFSQATLYHCQEEILWSSLAHYFRLLVASVPFSHRGLSCRKHLIKRRDSRPLSHMIIGSLESDFHCLYTFSRLHPSTHTHTHTHTLLIETILSDSDVQRDYKLPFVNAFWSIFRDFLSYPII